MFHGQRGFSRSISPSGAVTRLLVDQIDALRWSFRYVTERRPFRLDAVVVLPDHLHCIWTLPPGDTDFSMRWNLLKGHFSRAIEKGERISQSREKRRERGLWQRRFWEHLLRDQEDFNQHVDYLHWNPVKHGWVTRVADWPHSSFHDYAARGIYPVIGVSIDIQRLFGRITRTMRFVPKRIYAGWLSSLWR